MAVPLRRHGFFTLFLEVSMKQFLPLLLALILLTGCGTVKKSTNTVYAMDTVMSLTA